MEEIFEAGAVEAAAPAETQTAESVAVEAVPQKKKRKPINQQKLQDNLWGWIFCLPLIIGTVWFVYSALIMSLMLSFTNYSMGRTNMTLFEVLGNLSATMHKKVDDNGISIPGTVDPLWWYKSAFNDFVVGESGAEYNEMGLHLFNTVFYMIGIPIGMILSMFFAVCMSRDIKGGNVFRVLYYIPCVASTISIVYTFRTMFNSGEGGVINSLLGTNLGWMNTKSDQLKWNLVFGTQSTNPFMADSFWCQGFLSKLVIVIMSVWKGLGGTIILYVAGLSGVNAATKEAAQIDGANGWQIFWKVTMPDLYPTIFYNIVTSVIGGMQIYMEPVLFFGEKPEDNSYLTNGFVSLIYRHGLNTGQEHEFDSQIPSAGAAYGMILAVMIFVMTLFQFWLDSRKKD